MKRQFLHEAQNHEDKSRKPDYRSQMLPATKPPEAQQDSRLRWVGGEILLAFSKRDRLRMKQEFVGDCLERIDRARILIGRFSFSFRDRIRDFRLANRISAKEADAVFNRVKSEASERRRIVQQRLTRSTTATSCKVWDDGGKIWRERIELYVDLAAALRGVLVFAEPECSRILDEE